MMTFAGLATIIITALGGALALAARKEEPASRHEQRLGSNGGIITAIGSVAFCGWRILVEVSEPVWIADDAIVFLGAALMLTALGIQIGGALLDHARVDSHLQGLLSLAESILTRFAVIMLGIALLLFVFGLSRHLAQHVIACAPLPGIGRL